MFEEYGQIDKADDDCTGLMAEIVRGLKPSERSAWQKQSEEIVYKYLPAYGSVEAAIDAFEREHPEAA